MYFSFTTPPTPFLLSSTPWKYNLNPSPINLTLLPCHFVSYTQSTPRFLFSIMSTSSLLLSAIVPYIQRPRSYLHSATLPSHPLPLDLPISSSLSPPFPLSTSRIFSTGTRWTSAPVAVVANPGLDRSGSEFSMWSRRMPATPMVRGRSEGKYTSSVLEVKRVSDRVIRAWDRRRGALACAPSGWVFLIIVYSNGNIIANN